MSPEPTPYLAGVLLTTRQLQIIAENHLSAEDISLADNDYAWAMNQSFHEALMHRVIVPSPGNAKPGEKGLYFYAYSAVPSFEGKPSHVYLDDFCDVSEDLLDGLSLEVKAEFVGVQMGIIRWPRDYMEPEWLREDMYHFIEAPPACTQKFDGNSSDDTSKESD